MSVFSNLNFINQIIKDVGLTHVQEDVSATLQLLVQIQTRKIIQHSTKFMNNDSRDLIHFEDVQNALALQNHTDIVLNNQKEEYLRDGFTFVRRDKKYKNVKDFIEQQSKQIPLNLLSTPSLRGRWVYIEGKIPKTKENIHYKSKLQILSTRQKAVKLKDKKFNVISDCPQNLLTNIEEEYFKDVTTLLSGLSVKETDKLEQIDIDGNIINLLPMLLNYFNSTEITEPKMIYFLKLINNKYIEKSLQFYLHQILSYLWSYEGACCFKVGLKIGEIIQKFGMKYPLLYRFDERETKNISNLPLVQRQSQYAYLIKRMGIEFSVGITINIEESVLEMNEKDVKEGSNMAIQFKQTIAEYSSQISSFNEQLSIFNLPKGTFEHYMMMPF